MVATFLSPVATFEQREQFNNTFRYIRKNGLFTDEQIAALAHCDYINFCATAHTFAFLYRGEDEMLRDFSAIVAQGGVLSARRCRATLNAMYREGQKMLAQTHQVALPTPPVVEQAPVEQPATSAVANGYYTVQMGDGTHVTLLLEDDFRDTAPEGSQIAKYLFASDNTSDYAGFAFVTAGRINVWSKQRGKVARQQEALAILLNGGLDAAREAGHAYALESGRCARCGRLLTVEASVNRGLGPECAKKGWNG